MIATWYTISEGSFHLIVSFNSFIRKTGEARDRTHDPWLKHKLHHSYGPIKFCTNLMHVLIYWKLTCNEFNKTSRTQLMLCDSVDRLMEGDF